MKTLHLPEILESAYSIHVNEPKPLTNRKAKERGESLRWGRKKNITGNWDNVVTAGEQHLWP